MVSGKFAITCAKISLPMVMAIVGCAAEDYSHPASEVQIEIREKCKILQVSQLVTRAGASNVRTRWRLHNCLGPGASTQSVIIVTNFASIDMISFDEYFMLWNR